MRFAFAQFKLCFWELAKTTCVQFNQAHPLHHFNALPDDEQLARVLSFKSAKERMQLFPRVSRRFQRACQLRLAWQQVHEIHIYDPNTPHFRYDKTIDEQETSYIISIFNRCAGGPSEQLRFKSAHNPDEDDQKYKLQNANEFHKVSRMGWVLLIDNR